MRFNSLLNLIGFSGKAHRGSPASGCVKNTRMPEADAPSQVNSRANFKTISGFTYPSKGGLRDSPNRSKPCFNTVSNRVRLYVDIPYRYAWRQSDGRFTLARPQGGKVSLPTGQKSWTVPLAPVVDLCLNMLPDQAAQSVNEAL